MKIHYVGYESSYNKWKNEAESETMDEGSEASVTEDLLESYSFYKDLSLRIKKALTYNRTSSPQATIVMPFNILMFSGGLRISGIPTKVVGGNH